jgi:hypothetical protein
MDTPRSRSLLPRLERRAVELLEAADFNVAAAIAAVLFTADAQVRDELRAPRRLEDYDA